MLGHTAWSLQAKGAKAAPGELRALEAEKLEAPGQERNPAPTHSSRPGPAGTGLSAVGQRAPAAGEEGVCAASSVESHRVEAPRSRTAVPASAGCQLTPQLAR